VTTSPDLGSVEPCEGAGEYPSCGQASDQRAALAAEVGRLRAALEFYADPDTYFAIGIFADPPCGEFIDDFSEHGHPEYPAGDMRPGKRAREALTAGPARAAVDDGEVEDEVADLRGLLMEMTPWLSCTAHLTPSDARCGQCLPCRVRAQVEPR
jgi:hypothetical protein